MNLDSIRNEIDNIDSRLIELFTQRIDYSRQVAEYKMENSIPVFNRQRENEILESVYEKAGAHGNQAKLLYSTILELSRALQHDMLGSGSSLRNMIVSANTEIPFKDKNTRVASFSAKGSYSHQATKKIFPNCEPEFYTRFKDVFAAIKNNEADFGVIPIENSSAGSVTDVYDLMLKYRFYIAAEVDIHVEHCLAAEKGTSLNDIHKVYSFSQALAQCSDFINSHSLEAEEYTGGTAKAAKMLSEINEPGSAVICSEEAAQNYGLEIILRGFQNNPNNCTRFIVISKEMFITEDADKISLCFSLPHVTGSLYNVLCRFAAHGLNLTKIESRPIFGSSFEYFFYLDFTGNIQNSDILNLICVLSDELIGFSFLGNYKEI